MAVESTFASVIASITSNAAPVIVTGTDVVSVIANATVATLSMTVCSHYLGRDRGDHRCSNRESTRMVVPH